MVDFVKMCFSISGPTCISTSAPRSNGSSGFVPRCMNSSGYLCSCGPWNISPHCLFPYTPYGSGPIQNTWYSLHPGNVFPSRNPSVAYFRPFICSAVTPEMNRWSYLLSDIVRSFLLRS